MLKFNKPAIVIVGAGAAGIAAATKLISNGFNNVTVLEAENRIGGRLYSVHWGDTIVDLGAQWVHGEKGNIVYETVKDLNLVSHAELNGYKNFKFYTSNNSKFDENFTRRLCTIAEGIFDGEYGSKNSHNTSGTYASYFLDKFGEIVTQEFGKDNQKVQKVFEMIEEFYSKFVLCFEPADNWHEISAASLDTYQYCEGDQLINWRENGYSTILDVLISKIPNVSKEGFLKNIQINKEVTKIIWNQNAQVQIQCSDGTSYLADHVIVTTSVAVLKHNHANLFEPSLPSYKINCVDNIPLGTSHKIFLKFPEKWWSDDQGFSFLWTREDKENLETEFPGGPKHNGRYWLEDIFGFYPVENLPNILLGWVVGPMTEEIECLPDEYVQKASMFLLRKFIGSMYEISEPCSILRSKWGTNPHFLGAYSYIGTNTIKSGATHEDLAKPLLVNGKEVVLFAGESTHSKYFSTVHGAIESGFREAARLTDLYKSPNYHKIVIVGAGLAGLGAAKQCQKNSIEDFLILEAQDEAGGRIKTIFVDGKPLDLGAQWMHGKNNPLYTLAKENNLLAGGYILFFSLIRVEKFGLILDWESEEGSGLYIRSNGEIVDQFIVNRVSLKVGEILDDCAKFVNAENNHPSSLNVFLDEGFSKFLNKTNLNETDISKELYEWHTRFQVIDNSCKDLSRLSAKGWGEYVCLDDEAHSNLKYGYQPLIQTLLDSLPDKCIQYNAEVIKINYTKDKKVRIDVKGDQSIICDHLILTPSLGVLKDFKGLDAVLSENLIQNIQNMGFAGICKIYLFYEKRWWSDSKGFQLLWTQDCEFTEKDSWLRQITGFDEVFNHETALMAWVGGDAVQKVESLQTDEIGVQCTDLLRKFLTNRYSVPAPSKVIRTQWLSNPYVKGSYCHITPECDAPNSGIRALRKPVMVDDVPRIILAGEAIHPSHYSTTHGAYESGLDQAQVICDFISRSDR
ncbi:unnamed protein product [Ceutorhynchus assimilis]|uniref:Amine oxidase domain-containing protein n=1 Tax=Ceutorhynchus assimilis TaxID=467358 RepID=A0A9N9MT56_9CUCU|nr:unnamed protein product [Ceutorhynchus assimilis]